MLLQRTNIEDSHGGSSARTSQQTEGVADDDRPLTCMFYFFASQMQRNIQPADPDLVRRGRVADKPTHQLDSMLARLSMQAAFSPLVSKFETYPTQIPDQRPQDVRQRKPKTCSDEVHDTVLIVKFRDKRARQEWIATKEWQQFRQATQSQEVFRRMPHVRCASSVRGLMDPVDILTA
jgi:hypothetical protein